MSNHVGRGFADTSPECSDTRWTIDHLEREDSPSWRLHQGRRHDMLTLSAILSTRWGRALTCKRLEIPRLTLCNLPIVMSRGLKRVSGITASCPPNTPLINSSLASLSFVHSRQCLPSQRTTNPFSLAYRSHHFVSYSRFPFKARQPTLKTLTFFPFMSYSPHTALRETESEAAVLIRTAHFAACVSAP